MNAPGWVEGIGFLSALLLPLWNLPLILRIQRRRSSADISMAWAVGVLVCLIGMLPSGLFSPDPIYRAFTLVNLLFFSAVVLQVLRFR